MKASCLQGFEAQAEDDIPSEVGRGSCILPALVIYNVLFVLFMEIKFLLGVNLRMQFHKAQAAR